MRNIIPRYSYDKDNNNNVILNTFLAIVTKTEEMFEKCILHTILHNYRDYNIIIIHFVYRKKEERRPNEM